jgi:hypothetical protein
MLSKKKINIVGQMKILLLKINKVLLMQKKCEMMEKLLKMSKKIATKAEFPICGFRNENIFYLLVFLSVALIRKKCYFGASPLLENPCSIYLFPPLAQTYIFKQRAENGSNQHTCFL